MPQLDSAPSKSYDMMEYQVLFPVPLPDDPKKWDGWSKYKSPNLYERLCLDPRANPSNEIIEEHCRELMRWWQKKLPLKNQPSNPIAQLLRSGLDESSRYLTEARVELLDPERRQKLDSELAAQASEQAATEFHKYLTFALADGFLTPEEETSLHRFGAEQGLTEEQIAAFIEAQLTKGEAKRPEPEAPSTGATEATSGDPKEDFMRMLRLSGLDSDGMTDETRDAFINMAENLGIEPDEAEDLVDVYLEEADEISNPEPEAPQITVFEPLVKPAPAPPVVEKPIISASPEVERQRHANFANSLECQMFFVPSGEFSMGSEAPDAPPNERPLTKVTLSKFYMSRFPITNAEYEKFDPSHSRKRAPGAGDRHPVVYVSSLDAIKFCQSLSTRERKRYRLPTEAEWEYAARGMDARIYPWGNHGGRGDLANFADRNTVFAWSDRDVDDGHAESSPVGSYPFGASPFGMEDMAGNVWEWCSDYLAPYRGTPQTNPRGPANGAKRVYRGGSWKSRFSSLRATFRGSNMPNYSCNDLGFRVVCECE
ncbi:MAG TPA: SUMF1/EgtB/PvdO family nonheme iron enzyme [Chthoniobacterales bacterium]|jgi:formylglycine-generating enzyme required for sulfatase activity|nr:SUMF1/EgtB/PvdO family nonheme iron enzyme [Chthoniobacterales bacterium]